MKEISYLENFIKKQIILCPNKYCDNTPNIFYEYNPLNSIIKYKCNLHSPDNAEMGTSKFLRESTHDLSCQICQQQINNENNIFYCKKCNMIFDKFCLNKHINNGYNEHNAICINKTILYNNCLKHNNTFIFRCLNCNESLCGLCDLNFHNSESHELKQIINISVSKSEIDKKISEFEKQKNYLNKIKEMNDKIIKILENDILIKQRIIDNYKYNKFNYQCIYNFNQLIIKNNEKYENILKNIIDKYNEADNNNNMDKEFLLNQMLCPFYYSMMINPNQKFNNSLIDILENKFNDNNKYKNNIQKKNENIKKENNNKEKKVNQKKSENIIKSKKEEKKKKINIK